MTRVPGRTPSTRRGSGQATVLAIVLAASAVMAVPPGAVASPPALAAAVADPCATGANAIVCENSKAGTDPSVWDVESAGDDSIQGYATDISVDVGDRIDFKIDTDATAYTVDIYRTGWYGGKGARFITSVPGAVRDRPQPECRRDGATELYDCAEWSVSASWDVPTTAVSGVYLAHLRRPDTGDESHITFIVRDDASDSEVLFQTSDTTWQAYNTYGGSSFYQGAANGRAYKLSYNRPFATRGHQGGRDFYFSSEFAMVRFLERNGYDVSYIAGVDADRNGSLLANHEVFLSVGHDEYWSGPQRANVEAARDAGLDLAFFSGNEVYWRTRFEPAAVGDPVPHRTLVSYKETWGGAKIDPSPEWTGTWRDPRFAARSAGAGRAENGLTGTLYMSNDSDLPVTVSADEGRLRLWRGTSLASLAPGTSAELAPHTVGYESNEDLDNGERPAGLIRLSTTTGAVPEYLQDYGNQTAPGTTTHHTTLYRAPSGALVFSAGSVQWAWGLDQTHDGDGAPADPRMQQATVNLLADMGAQPTTLMAGLVPAARSTDTRGPTVAITSPAAGSAVPNGASVTLTGTATDLGGGRVAGVEVSTDDGATWHPATGREAWSHTYVQTGQGGAVPVRVRAVDDSANIGAATTLSLAVACPCSVFGAQQPAVPATNDAGAVELGLRFSATIDGYATGVRFYKGAGNTGAHTGSLWSATGARLATVAFTDETETGWQSAEFAAPVELTAGTTYVVSYTAPNGHYAVASHAFTPRGVEAAPLRVAGGFGAQPAGVFQGGAGFPAMSHQNSNYFVDVLFDTVDGTPLTASSQQPVHGATSVPPGAPISVVLSKPTAHDVAITVTDASGSPVAGSTAFDAVARTATFTPDAALAPSTEHTARVAALDALGRAIAGTTSWSFTTAAPDRDPAACPCSLLDDSTAPVTPTANDAQAVTVGVRFASASAGKVSAIRFYKGLGNTGTHTGTLWAADGTVLATATFTSESVTGWQTATFAQPVALAKDTEYVASYRAPAGRYSVTPSAFGPQGLQRGPLRTTASGGAYTYGEGFPGIRTSTGYLVDVVFHPDPEPLAVVAQSPAPAEPGAALTAPVAAEFNVALAAAPTVAVTAAGRPVAGATTLSADRRTVTFAPAAPLAVATQHVVTVSGAVSVDGVSAPPTSWAFTTVSADGCPCTMFGSQVPATGSTNDGGAVELGVVFTPTEDGQVTGVRFYKGAGNVGTHTGSLWTADGARLATVTFTNESASGWQTATFAAPVAVEPGASYVVSYLAPQGRYSATPSFFASAWQAGPLTAPAGGNGRYTYGGGFPRGSWQSTNYFVDAVFQRGAPTAPVVVAQAPPSGASQVSTRATVSAVLSKAPAQGTPVLALTGPSGAVAGTSAFDAATRTVRFTPAAPMPAGAVVAASLTLGGQALAGGAWSFTTSAAPPDGACPCSLWSDAEAPATASVADAGAVQVGTRLSASVAGTVTAVRFYKGPQNTGAHTVNLWDADGSLLATAPSAAESASGWQTVELASPVPVAAGQVLVAAYHSSAGRYAYEPGALGESRARGPLSTLPLGGAYVYGTGFPATVSAASYGVDVVFEAPG